MTYPYVGILINSKIFQYIKQGKSCYEKVAFYENAAIYHKVRVCFFRLKDINIKMNRITALIRSNDGKYIIKSLPIPKVIHNRGFFRFYPNGKIRKLENKGIIIFNSWKRYSKYKVHSFLMDKQELQKHLPETVIATEENLQSIVQRHKELIMKRATGTLGNGAIKVSSEDGNKLTVQYRKNGRWIKGQYLKRLPDNIRSIILNNKYIIQERVSLATYKSNPFDLRVSVQKNEGGQWQVSGIVGKVAASGSFLTNVAQGGICYTLEEVLVDLPHLELEKVQQDVETLGIEVAKQLELKIPNLADIGLDIGITNNGFPMFIECNSRDLRYSFALAKLDDQWEKTFETPIGYAKYLLSHEYREMSKDPTF